MHSCKAALRTLWRDSAAGGHWLEARERRCRGLLLTHLELCWQRGLITQRQHARRRVLQEARAKIEHAIGNAQLRHNAARGEGDSVRSLLDTRHVQNQRGRVRCHHLGDHLDTDCLTLARQDGAASRHNVELAGAGGGVHDAPGEAHRHFAGVFDAEVSVVPACLLLACGLPMLLSRALHKHCATQHAKAWCTCWFSAR